MTCGQAAEVPAPQLTQAPKETQQPSETAVSSDSPTSFEYNPFESNTPKPKRSMPIKAIAIGAGSIVVIIAVIAVVTGIANAKFINVENSPALNASLSPAKIKQVAMEKCDALALALPTEAAVQALNQRAAALTKYNSGTARKAQQILNASTWVYSTELKDIDGDLARVTAGSLDDVIAKTETIRESDRGEFANLWASPFLTMALDICGLTERVNAARSAQTSFTAAKTSLESYAATVPWYPEGFSEWTGDSNIAWKWVTGMYCDLGDWCWHIKVISDSGCADGVYAELNLLDSGDNVIGFTNDSVASLGAREVAIMELSTYNDRVDSGRLVTLNCHKY